MSEDLTQPLSDGARGGDGDAVRAEATIAIPGQSVLGRATLTATTVADATTDAAGLPQTEPRTQTQSPTEEGEFRLPLGVGAELGPVKLMSRLGRGGMGTVFLGYHRLLARNVAVKFLHVRVADADGAGLPTGMPETAGAAGGHWEQFFGEARASASVRHANLAEIYHADIARGSPYLVLEYVDGPNLSQLIESTGPLRAGLAVHVLTELAGALGALHDHDVVHRDVKPSNVMVDTAGRVVLTDLGLAVRRLGTGGQSNTNTAGTPAYMAPEMFEGRASPRSDIYALGVMAFRLLTGKLPFEGGVLELRSKHASERLPLEPLRDVGADDGLLEILERATHKQMVFRYKTAHEMARALREYAQKSQGSSRRAKHGRDPDEERAAACQTDLEKLVESHRRKTESARGGLLDGAGAPASSASSSADGSGSGGSTGTPGSSSGTPTYAETIARKAALKRERLKSMGVESTGLSTVAGTSSDSTAPTPPPTPAARMAAALANASTALTSAPTSTSRFEELSEFGLDLPQVDPTAASSSVATFIASRAEVSRDIQSSGPDQWQPMPRMLSPWVAGTLAAAAALLLVMFAFTTPARAYGRSLQPAGIAMWGDVFLILSVSAALVLASAAVGWLARQRNAWRKLLWWTTVGVLVITAVSAALDLAWVVPEMAGRVAPTLAGAGDPVVSLAMPVLVRTLVLAGVGAGVLWGTKRPRKTG